MAKNKFEDWAKERTDKPTKNETVKYYPHCIPYITKFLEMRVAGESGRSFEEFHKWLRENTNPPYKLSLSAMKAYMREYQPELFAKVSKLRG